VALGLDAVVMLSMQGVVYAAMDAVLIAILGWWGLMTHTDAGRELRCISSCALVGTNSGASCPASLELSKISIRLKNLWDDFDFQTYYGVRAA